MTGKTSPVRMEIKKPITIGRSIRLMFIEKRVRENRAKKNRPA